MLYFIHSIRKKRIPFFSLHNMNIMLHNAQILCAYFRARLREVQLVLVDLNSGFTGSPLSMFLLLEVYKSKSPVLLRLLQQD